MSIYITKNTTKYISKNTFLFLAVVFLLAAHQAKADTHTAKSANYADVSAAVTAASAGDTVMVPSGNATWSNTLSITKSIILIGAGTGITNTTIISATGSYIITYSPSNPALNAPFRVSGFIFNLNNTNGQSGMYLSSGGKTTYVSTKIRIDHNTFKNVSSSSTNNKYMQWDNIRGVVDHNLFDSACYMLRTPEAPDSGVWYWNNMEGVVPGKADNNFFFEDNVFNFISCGGNQMVDCQQGERYAFRYNTINMASGASGQALYDMHGNQGPDFYACFGGELYGNLINGGSGAFTKIRGGRAFVYNNWFVNAPGWDDEIYEECNASASPVNYVGPNPPTYSQDVSGTYIFQNKESGGGTIGSSVTSGADWCSHGTPVAGVNFFTDSSSPGVGCGSTVPAGSCTPNQGYWYTTQSCSNFSSYVGASTDISGGNRNPSNYLHGIFYQCGSNNQWHQYFTPLAYPHPLITDCNDYPTLCDSGSPSTCTPGDANGDKSINISDVQTCINVILSTDTNQSHKTCSDMSGDSNVNITDCQAIINKILNP